MSSERNNLLSPRTREVRQRASKEREGEITEREAETEHLLPTGKKESFAPEPLEVVNMGLQSLRAARGTATRRLRTVKKAWGTFKAKAKAKKHPTVPQPRLRPQQLWSITLSSPQTPSTRRLMLNSPLTPDPYATPDNHQHYRPTRVGTPGTPLTPLDGLRRSARIASRTPTPCRDTCTLTRRTRRTTPKRIQMSVSPGQILRDLNSMTLQVGQDSVSSGVNALKAMSMGLTETIIKQDSSSKLTKIQAKKPVAKAKCKSAGTDPMESKENDLEPKRRVRLRHNRGVIISQNAPDGEMLTEDFE